MIRNIKIPHFILYFILSMFYMESILRLSVTGSLFASGSILSLIFSIPFSIVLYIPCSFFKEKTNHILCHITLGLSAFIFSSQLLYYKTFKTFYTLYSAANAGQIFELWRDIIASIAKNLVWIILLFLPLISSVLLRKKLPSIKRPDRRYGIFLACCILLFHLTGLAFIYAAERGQYSAYDLYFESSYPVLSVKKLGLVTSMRLDVQRLFWGRSPALAESPRSPQAVPPKTADVPKEKKIEYNIMDIDFSQLISVEKNETIKSIHQYFRKAEPSSKNEYTGKYKGYNLILITAESFSPYAVRRDVTPTLYKLVNEGYNFTGFYTPIWGVSTSDGEYVAYTSLIPKTGVWSFYKSGKISMPFVLGNQLKNLGYKTLAYHNNTYTYYRRDVSYPNMGYAYKGLGSGLEVEKTWPESDLEMMEKTIPEYIGKEPFHIYYMTVSGHMRYSFAGNAMASKNKKYVQGLPYSEPCKAYIACQIELDRALEYLLNKLEEAGIADRTLIALSSDHYPYGLESDELEELAGHPIEKNFELFKNNFILYTKGMKPVVVDKPCSSLDILPTLSNLMGLEYDSRLLMGRDIFSDSEPLVLFNNKSFITDKGSYNAESRVFIQKQGAKVDEDYIKAISETVNAKFFYSARILETNYYKYVSNK
ncbi:LTA synthase family protein [Lutispora sp.]|uniref:LTA synthase family protein n=1 Tax=Lutispora sp. TaxID=2828727 RepID=UPI002B1ED100|nr:sulfatase-like hydrolase/transferase [Lutispora sp.]MEA4962149.1 sulfatase-like hydrolase/transferase [Lutispora sp.]